MGDGYSSYRLLKHSLIVIAELAGFWKLSGPSPKLNPGPGGLGVKRQVGCSPWAGT